jgi:hypothetical protein
VFGCCPTSETLTYRKPQYARDLSTAVGLVTKALAAKFGEANVRGLHLLLDRDWVELCSPVAGRVPPDVWNARKVQMGGGANQSGSEMRHRIWKSENVSPPVSQRYIGH